MSIIIHHLLNGARIVLNPFYECSLEEKPIERLQNTEIPTALDDIENVRKDWSNLKADMERSKNKVLQHG